MKRKLRAEDPAAEQFASLREIPGLSAADCREVIRRLRNDDKGIYTCWKQKGKFPMAHKMLQSVQLPGPKGLQVFCNSLPMLVAEKVRRSPLFARLLRVALEKRQGKLTLIIFSDEANPGNVLHARHPRKTNLVYACFLEFPILFVDSLWLPVSAVRADDVAAHETSYAEVMRHLLEKMWEETEYGVTIDVDDEAHLFFIDKVLLLNDHEGLRSVTGAKGYSCGIKPCCHCTNVLSMGRECPVGYVDISESCPSKFVRQTDEGLASGRERLDACRTKAERSKVESLLGWNADVLAKSMFASPSLRAWVGMQSLYLDSMHQYQSGGMIGQEIGLWYTAFYDASFALSLLQGWVNVKWSAAQGHQPPHLAANEKLFRYGQDCRGDASACSTMLPLLWAFNVDMLADVMEMQKPCASVAALYDVVRCLQRCKIDVAYGARLLSLQKKYMNAFQDAYGASHTRPKAHYCLHLQTQMQVWKKHIDCHVGEGKHRLFKRYVGPKISKLDGYAKSVLLHLTEMELSNAEPKERWTGQVLRNLHTIDLETAKAARLPEATRFARGYELGCVQYTRGSVLQASETSCVEMQSCVLFDNSCYLLVQLLHLQNTDAAPHAPRPRALSLNSRRELLSHPCAMTSPFC